MNCASLTRLLDEHGTAWLGDPALAAAADAHCSGCADCRAAVTCMRSLELDAIPQPTLLAQRVARLVAAKERRPAVVARILTSAAVLCGGLALAGAGWYVVASHLAASESVPASLAGQATSKGQPESGTATRPIAAASLSDAASDIARVVEAEESLALEAWSASILGALPDGDYFALLRVPPRYPAQAAEQGIEGEAVSEFTITSTGDVEDVRIVSSTDPVFDAPTIEATSRQKYKPRVVDGRGVAVSGVRNMFHYRLETSMPARQLNASGRGSSDSTVDASDNPPSDLDRQQFSEALAQANDCLETGDLRCMELELDRIMASYRLSAEQTSRLWHFYGYLHHRRGRYELAIEAYRNAASAATRDPSYLSVFPLMIVAYIHYELGQYQEAMNAASDYVRLNPNPQAVDYVFIDRLKSLGATGPAAR